MRYSWGGALGPTESALESLNRRRTYLTDIFWQAAQRSICPFVERVASTSRSHKSQCSVTVVSTTPNGIPCCPSTFSDLDHAWRISD
jgi:hypothetical protein